MLWRTWLSLTMTERPPGSSWTELVRAGGCTGTGATPGATKDFLSDAAEMLLGLLSFFYQLCVFFITVKLCSRQSQ